MEGVAKLLRPSSLPLLLAPVLLPPWGLVTGLMGPWSSHVMMASWGWSGGNTAARPADKMCVSVSDNHFVFSL